MKKLTALFFFSVITGGLYAQDDIDSTSLRAAIYTRKVYDARRSNELPLYNGLRHQIYPSSIEGNPYFQSLDWYTGSVVYDNVLYENTIMRFDQAKQEVVITHDETTGIFISLFSPRVKEFSFAGTKFLRLSPDTSGKSPIQTGFYQELIKGKITIYTRNLKEIDEKLEGTTLYRIVEDHIRYYALKDGVYYSIRKLNDLMDLMNDHRKEVQQFLSRSQLKYRRETRETIVALIQFYNQL